MTGTFLADRGLSLALSALLISLTAVCAGCDRTAGQEPRKQQSARGETSARGTLGEVLTRHGLVGQVTLIQFGRIDCANSNRELRRMIALAGEPGYEGVGFLRVETVGDPGPVESYYADIEAPFPVHHDAGGDIARAVGGVSIPGYVLLDRFARVRYRGPMPEQLPEWAAELQDQSADLGPAAPPLADTGLNTAELIEQTRLFDLDGRQRRLNDFAAGRGLVVIFADTRCPFAGEALGQLPAVAEVLDEMDIGTVVVNITDPAQRVREFYNQTRIAAPVLFDEGREVQHLWRITSVPTIAYISPAGAAGYTGPAVWENLAYAIECETDLPEGSVNFASEGTEYG